MLRIALPSQSLKAKEKRNLVLRIRYGSLNYGLHSHTEEDAGFYIQGHSIVHRPRKRIFPELPDYGRRRFFKPSESKDVTFDLKASKLTTAPSKPKTKKTNKAIDKKQEKDQLNETLDDDLNANIRFNYTSSKRGAPLEALHEHSDEEGLKTSENLKILGSDGRKVLKQKLLPEISNSTPRKMSYTGSRRYSKENDLDFYKRRNPSRAGSISAWSTSSDRSQTRFSLSRRQSKRWRSRESSRRSSKVESVDLDPTAWYGFHESPDEEKHIWFDYSGIDLTFIDVQQAVEKVIPDAFENKKITAIQFENVNVKQNNPNNKNKWHVELSDLTSKRKLVDTGLIFPKARKQKNRTRISADRSHSRIGRSLVK